GGRERRTAVAGRPGRDRGPHRGHRAPGPRHRGPRGRCQWPLPDARLRRHPRARRRPGRDRGRAAGRAAPGRDHAAARAGRRLLRPRLGRRHPRCQPVLRPGQRAVPGRAGRRLLGGRPAQPLRPGDRGQRRLPGPGRHHPGRGHGLRPGRGQRRLVEAALADGALGLSSGMDYEPGRFAGAAEMTGLCAPVAEAGATYVSHIRGYEADAWRGMAELTQVARDSGVAAHVSHYHGPANMLAGLIDAGRGEGLDLTFDSYPYQRGSSILAMVALPPELRAGDPAQLRQRLADPAVRAGLARDWFPAVTDELDRVTLAYIGSADWAWAEGLTLPAAARQAGLAAGELVCELVAASDTGAGCVFGHPP